MFMTLEADDGDNATLDDLSLLYVEDEEDIRTQLGRFLQRR